MNTGSSSELNMRFSKKGGFSSVFILMLFASLMIFITALFTHSLDKAAASIDETLTANAGTNILTEYNEKLYKEFGMLAHRADSGRLNKLASYYINTGLSSKGTLVHSKLIIIDVRTAKYNACNINNFSKALDRAFVKMNVGQRPERAGLTNFYGAALPSRFLGKTGFLSGIDGVFEVNPQGLALVQIQYIYQFLTETEAEYILFGDASADTNRNYTFASVYGIRCIADGADKIEDPIALALALAQAYKETEDIMNGMAVPFLGTQGTLKDYLRYMLLLVPESLRIARTMDIMQLSVGGGFSFVEYAFGCDITAGFRRGNKYGTITQTHTYF